MKKISLVITTAEGEKYPVIILLIQHELGYIAYILGDDMTVINTIVKNDLDDMARAILDFLEKLGTSSDFNLIQNDDIVDSIFKIISKN